MISIKSESGQTYDFIDGIAAGRITEDEMLVDTCGDLSLIVVAFSELFVSLRNHIAETENVDIDIAEFMLNEGITIAMAKHDGVSYEMVDELIELDIKGRFGV